MESQQSSEDQSIEEILRYFVEHPTAADSLDGIAKWRLSQLSFRSPASIAAALKKLVGLGFIEEIQIPGSHPVFRLHETNLAGASSFLLERERRDG